MRRTVSIGALAFALAGCGSGGGAPSTTSASSTSTTVAPPATIRLTSAAFADGKPIPRKYTCDAFDDSPELKWMRVPAGAVELALTLEDPGAPGGPFMHWSVFAIKPTVTSIGAGRAPASSKQGTNDFHQVNYGGPCPPTVDPAHLYVFTLYALRAPLDLPDGAPPSDVRAAIARTAIAQGRLTGTYARGG